MVLFLVTTTTCATGAAIRKWKFPSAPEFAKTGVPHAIFLTPVSSAVPRNHYYERACCQCACEPVSQFHLTLSPLAAELQPRLNRAVNAGPETPHTPHSSHRHNRDWTMPIRPRSGRPLPEPLCLIGDLAPPFLEDLSPIFARKWTLTSFWNGVMTPESRYPKYGAHIFIPFKELRNSFKRNFIASRGRNSYQKCAANTAYVYSVE